MPSKDEIQAQLDEWQIHDRWVVRREIDELPNVLWEDEEIERVVQGMYEQGSGLLVGTNKRLVFMNKGWASLKVEDFPYDKITSIQYSTGVMYGEIKVYASGNETVIKNVPKKAARDFAEAVRARVSAITEPATSPPTAEPAPVQGLSVVEQLERLGDLRDRGVLSEEEFAVQKAKILDA